jgi:hypothetical protein
MIIKDANVTELREAMVKLAKSVGLDENARVGAVVDRAEEDIANQSTMSRTLEAVLRLIGAPNQRGDAAIETVTKMRDALRERMAKSESRAQAAEEAVLTYWRALQEYDAAQKQVDDANKDLLVARQGFRDAKAAINKLAAGLDDNIPF